jgi:hypothetical protein
MGGISLRERLEVSCERFYFGGAPLKSLHLTFHTCLDLRNKPSLLGTPHDPRVCDEIMQATAV